MGKNYIIEYHCTNCGENQVEEIENGSSKPEVVECQNCGCTTAEAGFSPKVKSRYDM